MTHKSDGLDEWLLTRPESVQKLAAEFPVPMILLDATGTVYHLIGYTEDDCLLLSPVNPTEDYELALEEKVVVCAKHFRELKQ